MLLNAFENNFRLVMVYEHFHDINLKLQLKLTEGLLGNPTLWPQVVNRLTRHSLTLP